MREDTNHFCQNELPAKKSLFNWCLELGVALKTGEVIVVAERQMLEILASQITFTASSPSTNVWSLRVSTLSILNSKGECC